MKKVLHRSLADQIYESIKDAIIKGELKRGERIVEMDIAKQYEVSQAPVREALSRLHDNGFVISYRHKGTFVSNFVDKDVDELYSFRSVIEPYAIRRAIERATDRDLEILEQLYLEMVQADAQDDIEGMGAADIAFHTYVYKMADHQFMFQVWETLSAKASRIWWYLHYELYFPSLLEVAKIHQPLLEALRKRDADEAIRAFHAHTEYALGEISRRRSPSPQDRPADALDDVAHHDLR